jgi:hypothetical protein
VIATLSNTTRVKFQRSQTLFFDPNTEGYGDGNPARRSPAGLIWADGLKSPTGRPDVQQNCTTSRLEFNQIGSPAPPGNGDHSVPHRYKPALDAHSLNGGCNDEHSAFSVGRVPSQRPPSQRPYSYHPYANQAQTPTHYMGSTGCGLLEGLGAASPACKMSDPPLLNQYQSYATISASGDSCALSLEHDAYLASM